MKQHNADSDCEHTRFSNRLDLVLSIKLFFLLVNVFRILESAVQRNKNSTSFNLQNGQILCSRGISGEQYRFVSTNRLWLLIRSFT